MSFPISESEVLLIDLKSQIRQRGMFIQAFREFLIDNQDDVLGALRLDPTLRLALPEADKLVLKARVETASVMYVVLPHQPDIAHGIPAKSISFYERLFTDPDFRAQVKAEPRRAIQNFFGITIPSSINVMALDESVTERFVIIPFDFSSAITGGGTTIYDHAYRAKGWGNTPKKTSLFNPCALTTDLTKPECQTTGDGTYDAGNPFCEPVAFTADPTEPECPAGTCGPLWTEGL